ncbi:MAG: response regulator [Candidatus Omnitrophica bacterium]|nr:response regulator [Candidatus Omnitrophota bacterium]
MEKKKILVVDDEEELLELVAKSLSGEGYEVTTVTTAEDAMDKARILLPDLILIDIILPDMEGPEAVRALGEDSLTGNIPVIFLSGIVTRDQKGKASSEVLVGERRYKALSKPFSSKELMEEVRKTMN